MQEGFAIRLAALDMPATYSQRALIVSLSRRLGEPVDAFHLPLTYEDANGLLSAYHEKIAEGNIEKRRKK